MNTPSPTIPTTIPNTTTNYTIPDNTHTSKTINHPAIPTITIPPRPPPHQSLHICALSQQTQDTALTFLEEYAPVRKTHDLFPTNILVKGPPPSVDNVLTALSNGTIQPISDDDDEPLWAQAMASPECEYWVAGMHEELKSLQDMKVFVLIPRTDMPQGHRPLKGKLVCKHKCDDTGCVMHYKVQYVAKGFAQCYSINYNKTMAPTIHLESFHTILHLTASLDWDLWQFNIKTAFLHRILPADETMFMEQPPGFKTLGKEEWVMRLMKSIYGMKQAGHIWNQTFHNAVSEWGFKHLDCEWCVYCWSSPTGTIIFAVHVDDIITAGTSPKENTCFSKLLRSKWEITELGEPKYALGIAIT